MIISHKHQFIFIKTHKTAGTSIEIALSKFCGEDDVITKISHKDEELRKYLGYKGPQNYKRIPIRCYTSPSDLYKLIFERKHKTFFNHISAETIMWIVGRNIWNTYYKFVFDRNPFDRIISRYYWSTRYMELPPDINKYIESLESHQISNWPLYTINGSLAVNYVGQYENLEKDLEVVADRLGLPGKLSLPKAKSLVRINREHYSTILNDQSRNRIERECANEMALLGYRWSD